MDDDETLNLVAERKRTKLVDFDSVIKVKLFTYYIIFSYYI